MKKIIMVLAAVLIATVALPSNAQKIDEDWNNRFTDPIVNPVVKPLKKDNQIYNLTINKDNVKASAKRQVAKQKITLYANNRVMKMCREWEGCEEWARDKYALDTSFRITDIEVTYHFYPRKWFYELYVQTWENGHAHTYKFQKQEGQKEVPSCEEIDKFPGHPLNDPSQSVKRPSTKNELYKRWSSVIDKHILPKLILNENIVLWKLGLAEEQTVVWKGDKPIWKRTLYAAVTVYDNNLWWDKSGKFVIEIKQEYPNGPFIYSQGKWKEGILADYE